MIRDCYFFFQAEDGIRDYKVTGVQTCALPIWRRGVRGLPAPVPIERADCGVSARVQHARRFRSPRCGRESKRPTRTWRSSMHSIIDMAERRLTKLRWALGINGVLAIAFGVVILIWPGISLLALTILFGAYAAATGVVGLAAVISGTVKEGRGWLVLSSLLGIAVGVLVLLWTGISALALLYVIGAYAIALGIIAVGGAFWLPIDGGDTALLILSGLVSILFGIVIFARPGTGALVTLALIAAFALITGITELVVAIGGKRLVESDLKRAFTPPKPQ